MELIVKGKQIDVGEALSAHVEENLTAITEKYFKRPIDGTVVFSRDAHLFRVDISVHAGRHIQLQSTATGEDAYAAFEGASDRIAKRLRRHKRRLIDRQKEPDEPPLPAQSYVLDAEAEMADENGQERHVIIAEMTTDIESLSVSDAVMRLDLGDLPALMFRNPAHGGLNMVYRRADGHIGWVDPRGTRNARS